MNRDKFIFNNILNEIGDAGYSMTQFGAMEGAAGNISVFARHLEGIEKQYGKIATLDLPIKSSALEGGWVVITGTGRRVRDVSLSPETSICLLHILPGGKLGDLYAADDIRPTIEWNTHLAVHNNHTAQHGLNYHAIVHTQPLYITYLSHLPEYNTTETLTRRLIRWEPETICVSPEGIGIVPFQVPGSREQMEATLAAMKTHRLVVWQRHGTVSCSEKSVRKACDLVEYAETAARFEVINLQCGKTQGGMPDEEILRICKTQNIQQDFVH